MEVLESQVQIHDEEHRANRSAMDEAMACYRKHVQDVLQGGGPEALAKHAKRGKLTARQRIDQLLDSDAPFLELGALAANGMYDGEAPAAGIVTGIGRVEGRLCMIVANDAT